MEKSRRLARVNALAEKLRFLPHLSEKQRLLYAWSLEATPDERWKRSQEYLRSVLAKLPAARKEFTSMILPLPDEVAAGIKRLRKQS